MSVIGNRSRMKYVKTIEAQSPHEDNREGARNAKQQDVDLRVHRGFAVQLLLITLVKD
jgi:hypothetical protein